MFIVTIDVRLEEMSNSLSFLESYNFGPYPSALLRISNYTLGTGLWSAVPSMVAHAVSKPGTKKDVVLK